MDLEAFRWLLTDARPGAAGPGRRSCTPTTPATRCAPPSPAPGRDVDPEHAAAALTQVDLRARAVPKFGDDAGADVLHPRRPRAGHPRPGRRAPRRPDRVRRARLGARPRLRHRRRPGRAGPGRADRRRRRPRPGCASRWPAPTSRRSASAARCRSPTAEDARRLAASAWSSPTPPVVRRGGGCSTSTAGRRRGVRDRAARPAVRASRSRRASRTTWCPTASRPSGSPTSGEVKEAALWSPHLATARRRRAR